MKTKLAIIRTESWNLKTEDGKELAGDSAVFLNEDYELHRFTLKGDFINLVKNAKLPAVFEADVKIGQKYNKGKASLKYEINSLKLEKEVQIFSKA